MVVKLSFHKEDILKFDGSNLFLKLHFFSPFAYLFWACIIKNANTVEEFNNAKKVNKTATVSIGQNGGFSIERL